MIAAFDLSFTGTGYAISGEQHPIPVAPLRTGLIKSNASGTPLHRMLNIADAVIALVSNIALANPTTQSRIEFKPEWFDIASDETPEGVKPDTKQDRYKA